MHAMPAQKNMDQEKVNERTLLNEDMPRHKTNSNNSNNNKVQYWGPCTKVIGLQQHTFYRL